MRKFLVVFFLLFINFCFVGCTSASNLSSINTNFSSIYFAIDFSETGFNDMGNEDQARLKVEMNNLAGGYIEGIKLRYNKILDNLAYSNKITTSQKILLKNHLTPYVGWNDSSYIIEFRFYSTLSSRIFITSAEYSGAVNENGTFSTKTYEKYGLLFSKTETNITDSGVEEYFNYKIREAIRSLGNGLIDNFKNPNYYYFFVTENPRLHAVNADETVSLVNQQIFCFYSSNEGVEPTFEFYVVQANQFVYYLIALAITFMFLAVYLIIIYFKTNKDNNMKYSDEIYNNKNEIKNFESSEEISEENLKVK